MLPPWTVLISHRSYPDRTAEGRGNTRKAAREAALLDYAEKHGQTPTDREVNFTSLHSKGGPR